MMTTSFPRFSSGRWTTLALSVFLAITGGLFAANPIITDTYTADPATLVHDDTVYLYVGHDQAALERHFYDLREWLVFSSQDLVQWESHPVPLSVKDFKWAKEHAWAAHVVERDGKFYWYVTLFHDDTHPGFAIGVAVSDSPTGPFKDAIGAALVTNDMTEAPFQRKNGEGEMVDMDWDDIDPAVYLDEDGAAYLFWGNTTCRWAKLKDNMTELDGPIHTIDLPNFTEAPWVHKKGDWYYLTYAYQFPEKTAYAMSKSIEGPWEFKGILNELAGNCNTNHQAILQFRGKDYFVYHNGGMQPDGGSFRRSVCIDRLYYNADGTLKRVVMTSEGVPAVRDAPIVADAEVPEGMFTNPLNKSGPDPWMTFYDGNYYLAATTWADAEVGLTMRKAPTIAELKEADQHQIYQDSHPERSSNFWAPEFFLLEGPNGLRWYGYYTGGAPGTDFVKTQFSHVIESAGTDPMGPYTYKGKLVERNALDATIVEIDGTLYSVYSVWNATQDLAIIEMKSPWESVGAETVICRPELPWERQEGTVTEGPVPLYRDGKIMIIYSASACWGPNYKLGMLTYNGGDPLKAESWEKHPEPLFVRDDSAGVFAPGHNTFFKSPDGTEDWMCYHANDSIDGKCDMDRTPRIQPFTWNADGTPDFAKPVPVGVPLPVPSR